MCCLMYTFSDERNAWILAKYVDKLYVRPLNENNGMKKWAVKKEHAKLTHNTGKERG